MKILLAARDYIPVIPTRMILSLREKMRSSSAAAGVVILVAATAFVAVTPVRAQQAVGQRARSPRAANDRRPEDSSATTIQEGVVVTTTPLASPTPGYRAKLEHIMPEVAGTQITVTKKATTIKLDKQPPVENNNLQELFTKAPGLIVSEQQNPGQYNFSYRGLGNPQESEYTLFLQDGLPLMADWIGFPTLYYLPVPQSVSEIQVIRGGSSLLYGPEPAPAVNYVTKRPAPGSPWGAYVEQTGGPDNTYSSYASVGEASGPVEFRMDGYYRTSDTQRDFNHYDLWQANGYVGCRPDSHQLLALDVHAHRFEGEDPGRLNYGNGNWIPTAPSPLTTTTGSIVTPSPSVTNWNSATTGSSRPKAGSPTRISIPAARPISARSTRRTRSAAPSPPAPPSAMRNSTTAASICAPGNAGAATACSAAAPSPSAASFTTATRPSSATPSIIANTGPGFLYAPRGTTSAAVTLDQDRTADYQSIFIEDLIRIGKFHIVPSFRLDHESVDVDATRRALPGPRLA